MRKNNFVIEVIFKWVVPSPLILFHTFFVKQVHIYKEKKQRKEKILIALTKNNSPKHFEIAQNRK